MTGSIFLENGDALIEMKEQAWDAEDRLQALLAKYPNLLAGDQMNELSPRRWLLISREFGIPGEVDAAGRWSVDHLFLDQDAIPTLVEVKRSTDTRIRREVVGQMLDYASHLVTNVSAERIHQRFEATYSDEVELADALAEVVSADDDPESYWEKLNDNIAASKLRLVFVADEFPPELRRIVEFMNRAMQQVDVFAVEVRQFVNPIGTHRILVPRLIGRVESKVPSGSSARTRWDLARFELTLSADHPEFVDLAARLLKLGTYVTGRDVDWGTGKSWGSFSAAIRDDTGPKVNLFSVYTTAEVSVNVGWSKPLRERDAGLSEDIRRRVNDLVGMEISAATWERGWPMIPLANVADRFDAFSELLTETATRVRAALAGETRGV